MIIFMFRPSPQCPKPSLAAAMHCFPLCSYNIYMHRDQIKNGNIDMTWIFTQAMFMTVNTILWTLSYEEIRLKYKREEVQRDLEVALECIRIASERWPGVVSALELYKTLIAACLRIYDKKGDVEVSVASPSDTTGFESRSNTTSPVATMAQPFAVPKIQDPIPDERPSYNQATNDTTPFGQLMPLNFPNPGISPTNGVLQDHQRQSQSSNSFSSYHHDSDVSSHTLPSFSSTSNSATGLFDATPFDTSAVNQQPLPANFRSLGLWNPDFDFTTTAPAATVPALERFDSTVAPPFASLIIPPNNSTTTNVAAAPGSNDGLELIGDTSSSPAFATMSPSNVPWADYLYPPAANITSGHDGEIDFGLTREQQEELMDSLSGPGIDMMQGILDATNRVFYPPNRQPL